MLANANPLEAVPASRSVREFIAVYARHNVPYGDLNCLPNLLRELKVNKHFAMHFWSAVAGMTTKQAADSQAVLTAIVEAVTGRTLAEVREAGPAHRILIGRLEGLLAGHDVDTEDLQEQDAAVDAAAPVAAAPVPSPDAEHVLPIRRAPESKRQRGRRRSSVEPEPIPPITNPAWTRDESLRIVLVPEPPAPEPVVKSQTVPGRRARLNSTSATPEARPTAVPLSGYADDSRRHSISGGLVLGLIALVLLGGGGYLYMRGGFTETINRLGTSVRAGYDSAISTWKGEPAQNTTAAVVPVPTPAASGPPPTAPAPASVARQPAAVTPAPAKPPVQQTRTTPAPGLTPAQNMAAIAAYNQKRDTAQSSAVPTDVTGGLVSVPEATMDSYLVVSRVPVLPQEARENSITGIVRMQATINRSGYVSRLHVLQGPTELRHPALEAASAWRYRPYLVNGQPVDVTTTITVDFSSLR
jgi:protein TonB